MTGNDWSTPPPELQLDDAMVHVWRADLDQPQTAIFRALLSVDERARADRFRFEPDRTHFVVARGALRVILGRYLGVEPADIAFRYNAYGKPAIAIPAATSVRFNVSHSAGVALFAVAHGREVGIDIEAMRTDFALANLARHTFSSAEYAAFCRLAPDVQAQGFFRCWTRKEAYVKARGMGVSLPLDQFEVSLGEQAALLGTAGESDAVLHWSLEDIAVDDGFAAAVAAEGQDWHQRRWRFDVERWLDGGEGVLVR